MRAEEILQDYFKSGNLNYRKVEKSKSLGFLHPEIMKEWDFENNIIDPFSISSGSSVKAVWKCRQAGHIFITRINARSHPKRNKRGECSVCSGQAVLTGVNDIETTHPEHAAFWDYEQNADLFPTEVSKGSHNKVWWKCSNFNHSFKMPVFQKIRGTSCNICSNHVVLKGFNDIVTTCPELMQEWDYEKNTIDPFTIHSGYREKVSWKCLKDGYSFSMAPLTRKMGQGCSLCAGRVIITGLNDIATKLPQLIKFWDYSNNGILSPQNIGSGFRKKVNWHCRHCSYTWTRTVFSQSRNNYCSSCFPKGSSKQEIILRYYLTKFLPKVRIYTGLENEKRIDIIAKYNDKTIHVEYDGSYWHSDLQKDYDRDTHLLQKDSELTIIRIRERDCPVYIPTSRVMIVNHLRNKSGSIQHFYPIIREVAEIIGEISSVDIAEITFDTEQDAKNLARFFASHALVD